MINKLNPLCNEVYVGIEAFTKMEILPNVIKSCRSKGLMVHLLTRGQQFGSFEDAATALMELRQHGDFTVLVVCDNRHWDTTDKERLAHMLKAIKNVGIFPELLYLKRSDETIPSDLLFMDEINHFFTIYSRTADNLFDFMKQKEWRIVGNEEPAIDLSEAIIQNDIGNRSPGMADFPLFFQTLVLETTHLCNARCSHCYTSCGPDQSPERMPLDQIKRVIDEASALPNLFKRCHVGGGEATIFWDEMLEILKHAKDHGFTNSIVTNGWWGKTLPVARRKISELKLAGVELIEFSVDAMHQEFVSSEPISYIIQAAKESDIRITLRVCTTKSRRADAVIGNLSGEVQSDITIATSKVVPIGRAKEAIPLEDIWTTSELPIGSCHTSLNLAVLRNGDVFPCCAGSEICPSLKLGNAFEQPLPEIMKALRGNFLVRALVHAGPAYFAILLQEAGLGDRLLPEYGSICHLCTQICTDQELTGAVQQKLEEKILGVIPKVAGFI
ncbi:radical SAM protein [Paenibacillus sophorae]|nr:radical SAM protein [Paenibacillus sophorae]QWU16909.1 radical SAM protein [Paenibacillus sophorae]